MALGTESVSLSACFPLAFLHFVSNPEHAQFGLKSEVEQGCSSALQSYSESLCVCSEVTVTDLHLLQKDSGVC